MLEALNSAGHLHKEPAPPVHFSYSRKEHGALQCLIIRLIERLTGPGWSGFNPIISSSRPRLNEIQLVPKRAPLHAQIMAYLQTQEEPFRQLEIARQAQIRICRYSPLTQYDLVNAARRNANGAGQCIL